MSLEKDQYIGDQPVNKHLFLWHADDPVALVRRAQGGDFVALAEVATKIYPHAAATANRIMHGADDAEDVTQEALVTALTQIGQCRNETPGSFPKWVSRIVFSKAQKSWRKSNRLVPTDPSVLFEREEPGDGFEDGLVDDLNRSGLQYVLNAAIERLNPREKTVVARLRNSGNGRGLSYNGMAEAEGMPIGSIGPTRGRAVRKLRAAVEPFI